MTHEVLPARPSLTRPRCRGGSGSPPESWRRRGLEHGIHFRREPRFRHHRHIGRRTPRSDQAVRSARTDLRTRDEFSVGLRQRWRRRLGWQQHPGQDLQEQPLRRAEGQQARRRRLQGRLRRRLRQGVGADFGKKLGITSTHTGTQEITGKLQPRFNAGNPPDIVDDSAPSRSRSTSSTRTAPCSTSARCSTPPRSTTRARRSATC